LILKAHFYILTGMRQTAKKNCRNRERERDGGKKKNDI
jgi:hypothetical protein